VDKELDKITLGHLTSEEIAAAQNEILKRMLNNEII
jgi:hypothetical protein